MNKRVAIEIPEAMYRLLNRNAALHGVDADAYVSQILHKHLEDLHDIAIVKAYLDEIRTEEPRIVTMDDLERDLGLDDDSHRQLDVDQLSP